MGPGHRFPITLIQIKLLEKLGSDKLLLKGSMCRTVGLVWRSVTLSIQSNTNLYLDNLIRKSVIRRRMRSWFNFIKILHLQDKNREGLLKSMIRTNEPKIGYIIREIHYNMISPRSDTLFQLSPTRIHPNVTEVSHFR